MHSTLSRIGLAVAGLGLISGAAAAINVHIGINPFGFGNAPPPPVVYQPAAYYDPPPVVYVGGGSWGGDRGRRDRGRGDDRRHR